MEAECRRGEHARLLDDFIDRHCRVDAELTVSSATFKEAFEFNMDLKTTSQLLAAQLEAKGFHRERASTGSRARLFRGLYWA